MKKVRQLFCILLFSVLAVTLCPAQSNTDANAIPPEDIPIEDVQLEMNFKDAPLQTVVEYLSEKAGLVILSDTGLDQRITVISRSPVDVDEAIGLIDSVLKDSGFSAVRQGRTLRIVTLEQARLYSMPVVKGTDPNAVEASDSMEYRILPVRYRSAEELAENLQPLMPDYAILQANKEGNVLLITDTRANIKRILEIVAAMDQPMSAVAKIQVFRLRNADAASTAELISNIFKETATSGSSSRSSGRGGGDRGGRGGGPGGMFEMMRARMGGDRSSSSGSASSSRGSVPVSASADSRTNSVVVSASEDRMMVIQQMIEGLDTATTDIADVKVYHLEYADAENTAELINDVFGGGSSSRSSSQQSSRSFRGPGGFNPFDRGGDRGRGGDTSSSSSNAEVIASADQRTNSIVVSGPPETLMVIEQIIKELDANPEQERQIFTYPLKNANAANVMEILNSLFEEIQNLNQQNTGRNTQSFQGGRGGGGGQSSGSTSSSSSSAGGLDEETYFEADEESNTLLIMTSAKNYKLVEPIIDKLDLPVGQVLIKVLFAEVTHSDSVDLGTEFSRFNILNGNNTVVSATSSFGTPTSGMTFNSVAGDLDLAITALQETGRLNVLSRPYILTSNNQTATITVGEEVPIPTGTSLSDGGTSQTSVEYRDDIGIVLEVTLSINPDGLVNMTVSPRITTRTADKVQVSDNLFAETFATRSADTKVAVRNGHTIVIGGLIEDQLSRTVKKVPLLGDIPLVGMLFRRTIKEKSKTELLIFLTPLVASDANDLVPISDIERKRSNLNTDPSTAEIFKQHMDAMDTKVEKGVKKPE